MVGSMLVVIAVRTLPTLDGGVPQLVAPAPSVPQPRSLLDPLPALKRPPPDEVYRLRDAKDGTGELVYEEAAFTARVARDGTVQFKPKRVSEINLLPAKVSDAGEADGFHARTDSMTASRRPSGYLWGA